MKWITPVATFSWMDQLKSWTDDHNPAQKGPVHILKDIGKPIKGKDLTSSRASFSCDYILPSFIGYPWVTTDPMVLDAAFWGWGTAIDHPDLCRGRRV